MKFTHSLSQDVLLVKVEGDLLGAENSLALVDLVNDKLNEGVIYCVLDLASVRYMNSSGIGMLVTVFTKYKNKGGNCAVMNPGDQIQKLLSITKLDSLIKSVDSPQKVK